MIKIVEYLRTGIPDSNNQTFVHWVPLSSLAGYAESCKETVFCIQDSESAYMCKTILTVKLMTHILFICNLLWGYVMRMLELLIISH